MGNKRIKKTNNQGSTLILVLIIVSFIAILGTVCISTAMVNFKMKNVDKEAKRTFYTSEEAVDEIYAGLGKLSMQMLDSSYQEVMAEVTEQTNLSGVFLTYRMSNDTANNKLRQKFTEKMVSLMASPNDTAVNAWQVTDGTKLLDASYKTALITKLNLFLENPAKANVKSIGAFRIDVAAGSNANINIYTITFSDCVVEYINKDTGYYSDVTFNGVVSFPDIKVAFTEEADEPYKAFKDYVLIGNEGIDIAQNKIVNVGSSVFAGSAGLNVAAGSTFNIKTTEPNPMSKLITSGNINLHGASGTAFGVVNTNVWCNNLYALVGGKSNVNIDNNSSLFVKDDLQIDGDGSNVTIAGSYYGYSYEGVTANAENDDKSSAIIVNGTGASLDMSNISTLVIGGRAYVDFVGLASTYVTGESLSLKGNQEAYLVPSSLITDKTSGKQVNNPVLTQTRYNNSNITLNANNFFGFSFLNATTPYFVVANSNDYYVYLNFKSETDTANYFKTILLNDIDFEAFCVAQGVKSNPAAYKAYWDTRNYMKSLIKINMSYLTQSAIVNPNGAANVYTNATLINADLGSKEITNVENSGSSISGITTVDTFATNALDLSNRYTLLCSSLYAPPLYNISTGNRAIISSTTGTVDYYNQAGQKFSMQFPTSTNLFENVINNSYLVAHASTPVLNPIGTSKVMYATTGDVTLGTSGTLAGYDGGIIISGGTVTVQKNFHGLIIARGTIVIEQGVTVDNIIPGYGDLENFLNNNESFKKYFMAWNSTVIGASGVESIAGITYKDIVKIADWKKTEVSTGVDGVY